MIVYGTALALVLIGLYTITLKKNLVKMIMGLSIMEVGVNLFLISLGFRENATAPIYTLAPKKAMVSATPQALTLTNIVIGIAVTALLLALAIKWRETK